MVGVASLVVVASLGDSPGGVSPSGGGVARRLATYHAIAAPPIRMISASASSGSPDVPVGWPSIGTGVAPGDDGAAVGVGLGEGVGVAVGEGVGVAVGVGVGVGDGEGVGVAAGVGVGVRRGVGVGVDSGVGFGVGVSVASGASVSAAGGREGTVNEASGGRLGRFDCSPSGIDGRADDIGPPQAASATACKTTAKGRAK